MIKPHYELNQLLGQNMQAQQSKAPLELAHEAMEQAQTVFREIGNLSAFIYGEPQLASASGLEQVTAGHHGRLMKTASEVIGRSSDALDELARIAQFFGQRS